MLENSMIREESSQNESRGWRAKRESTNEDRRLIDI